MSILRRLPFLAWLVLVWIALWGDLSVANVLSGVAVASLLLMAFPHAGPGPAGTLRPLRALVFLAYFTYRLVEANLVVAWEVITPNNESINEGIVAVPVTGASDAVITILANAISLTPGTLTLEVSRDPAVLYVHVLHLRDIEAVRRDVHTLETLALRAFADEATIAACRQPTVHSEASQASGARRGPDEETT